MKTRATGILKDVSDSPDSRDSNGLFRISLTYPNNSEIVPT